MRAPSVKVEDIKDRVGILDLLDEMGARMQGRGSRVSVWCPFCADQDSRNPSAVAYTDTESYYCFQCNEGGDVISIAAAYLETGFRETLEWLNSTFLT